jgi:hypothetical protein
MPEMGFIINSRTGSWYYINWLSAVVPGTVKRLLAPDL